MKDVGFGPGGSRLVTIKDIGKAIGVSHVTVSRALNDSPLVSETTREMVRNAAREMGYRPDNAARTLRGSTSNLIGFVLPDIRNNFYSRIAEIVARFASDRGFQLVLSITDDDPAREERHLVELQHARARAIIITPSEGLTPASAAVLAATHAVQMVRRHSLLHAELVVADDRSGVGQATRHLIGKGHRRIAYVGGGHHTLSTGIERLEGYRAAMDEAGLSAEARVELGAPQSSFGYEASKRLLVAAERPEAIVLGSSQLTIGFLDAIAEVGLAVPSELSFVGYDDPDWFAHWGKGITTVHLPVVEIARTVAAIACGEEIDEVPSRIDTGGDGARTIVFPCEIVSRASVSPPTHGA